MIIKATCVSVTVGANGRRYTFEYEQAGRVYVMVIHGGDYSLDHVYNLTMESE